VDTKVERTKQGNLIDYLMGKANDKVLYNRRLDGVIWRNGREKVCFRCGRASVNYGLGDAFEDVITSPDEWRVRERNGFENLE